MNDSILLESRLGEREPVRRGKVRDIYDLNDSLLIVATDRVSAFDVVLPTGVPFKGKVLTALSLFWFKFLEEIAPNHLLTAKFDEFPPSLKPYKSQLGGRSMCVLKAEVVPIECVIRGYLAGSGWKEYRQSQSICGVQLPAGLRESEKLPEPIFTPTSKAETGHDEPMNEQEVADLIGQDLSNQLRDTGIQLYSKAAEYAVSQGVIIADTKFEFGMIDGRLHLIDEVLTPDSSRFWDAANHRVGQSQDSFDKQFVRDYLETLDWDKTPPAPELPPDVVARTSEKYKDAYRRIVGEELTH